MRRESCKYIWDALEAAKTVEQFMMGKTLNDYLSDLLLHSAIERQLLIVGEALSQLARRFPEGAYSGPAARCGPAKRHLCTDIGM